MCQGHTSAQVLNPSQPINNASKHKYISMLCLMEFLMEFHLHCPPSPTPSRHQHCTQVVVNSYAFFMVVECSCICVKSSTFVRLDAMYWWFLVHPPIRWQCDSCDSCAEETLNGSQLLQLVKESFDIHLISKKILSWKSSEIWIYHIHWPDTDNIRLISSMLTFSN